MQLSDYEIKFQDKVDTIIKNTVDDPTVLTASNINDLKSSVNSIISVIQSHQDSIQSIKKYQTQINTYISELKELTEKLPSDFIQNLDETAKNINQYNTKISEMNHYAGLISQNVNKILTKISQYNYKLNTLLEQLFQLKTEYILKIKQLDKRFVQLDIQLKQLENKLSKSDNEFDMQLYKILQKMEGLYIYSNKIQPREDILPKESQLTESDTIEIKEKISEISYSDIPLTGDFQLLSSLNDISKLLDSIN